MRRRTRIIHGGGRASQLDRELGEALQAPGGSGSVPVEIMRERRGGEYVWRIAGESSLDEDKIRRAAQKVVDDLRAAGVEAHVKVTMVHHPHGGW